MSGPRAALVEVVDEYRVQCMTGALAGREHRRRGIEPASQETYGNGVLKVIYRDPDGNEIGFGGAPLKSPARPDRGRSGCSRTGWTMHVYSSCKLG